MEGGKSRENGAKASDTNLELRWSGHRTSTNSPGGPLLHVTLAEIQVKGNLSRTRLLQLEILVPRSGSS